MGKFLECLRIILCMFGYFMAYYVSAAASLLWITGFVVVPLTFLSGLEGMFFSSTSMVGKDWGETKNRFAIQGRLNFFAISITAILVLIFKMNLQAQLTICLVAYIFFGLSSINHLISYIKDKASGIQLERFMLTVALWAGFIPLLLRVKPLL